jgi:hypothetical protein
MGPALEVTPEQSSTVSQPHHSGEVISRCRRGVPQRELMQPSVDHAAIGGSWHDAAVMATVGGAGRGTYVEVQARRYLVHIRQSVWRGGIGWAGWLNRFGAVL